MKIQLKYLLHSFHNLNFQQKLSFGRIVQPTEIQLKRIMFFRCFHITYFMNSETYPTFWYANLIESDR